ncbi:Pumilio domain-containing protein C56F2.08c [Psilocybe cubensis]|uniref:Pumilio domain-containing protein C56F2.08c n=2 Tax=Psilocybe cubensis TaxID=181762 RepID=A0ACB8H708_PSICU|nr:Pumilio domain-containing protein C56F2.08c [Psilocybe cubensis]KAH9483775.1 Pumilio domain-containing protein C56F2.08c [Psilocybe cubensis]
MSLSANDNNGSYSRVPPSGKTPPPAPSAAFAKRARELQGEGLGGRYLPPALRGMSTGGSQSNEAPPSLTTSGDGSILPPTNYPPGFRRARAGTLPSNVQLAAQRLAASTTDTPVEQIQRQSSLSSQVPALTSVAPGRPGLRHSSTTVPPPISSTVGERASRLRSGSLTLPTGGLSNAFGPSIFSSSWLSTSTNGSAGFSVLDELRSVTSADSGADDFDVHTLDYLGLDDSHRPPPPAATISELRTQTQAAIAGNLASTRMRATTVSNPYRTRPSLTGSLLSTPAAEEEEEYFVDSYDNMGYDRQQLGAYDISNSQGDFNQSSYLSKTFKATENRPRAISVGILDDPMRSLQRRAISSDANSYLNEISQPGLSLSNNLGNPSGILKTDKLSSARAGVSPSVHFPPNGGDLPIGRGASAYLLAPGGHNRSVSPKSEQPSTQLQTPTRSLWIGNLDSAVTSEQLIHVFAPYGAIESLRLLPEKECGFVNFVDQADAIRAKDDVLNRLGGNIGMPNGQTVRIGFGKADSAPVAPAKGNPASPGPTSPSNAGTKSAGANAGLGGMDAQLQSTPTRALWIGSIPSSTTPATILSVFSPYGPIESARVLTHKNCGFINFERLDDAVRARKALNGRDVLGSDVGAIRIGFAKVPVKNGQEGTGSPEESTNVVAQGVGDLSVGATIHALRGIKGASTIPAEQQVLGGVVENYRSNLLLSMISSGLHNSPVAPDGTKPAGFTPSVTEQQMILRELSGGSSDAEADIQSLSEFRPPTMYYTTIPLVSERTHNRRWDASKLRELRKRLDSGTMTVEEIDQVAADFMDSEIVDLASDWLGNTVVQKLFERCSAVPRVNMLERICPHLAMIGIHKNGTWAAQKIIECVSSPDEVALIAQNLRAYAPPLLLDQFGNYVIQCCLRFGAPANDFIFDAIVDRMWEIAQGRFGARSMRACLESPHITLNQQRRIATAIILNSIPLATNPNGALLLTWLLDTSGFPSRYNLLAPRFTPHLSHLCTHKLASLTVLRIVNQKIEPDASRQIVEALFNSPGDHVLTDVLGDQVNGVAVVHKILTSPFIDPAAKQNYIEATKRVLIELKVIATQAYRRLIEEVGLPVPNFQPTYNNTLPPTGKVTKNSNQNFGVPGLPSGYPSNDQGFASMMAALQMGGQNPQAGPPNPPQLHVDPAFNPAAPRRTAPSNPPAAFSPSADFSPFGMRQSETGSPRQVGNIRRGPNMPNNPNMSHSPYANQSPVLSHGGPLPGMNQLQPAYGGMPPPPQSVPPHAYQPYMYQPYPQNPPSNMGTFHA